MLKFIKGNLEAIDDVSLYPIISLLIFFIFFAALFTYALTAKKSHINALRDMPMDDNLKTYDHE